MRRLTVVCLLVAFGASGGAEILACGDKVLVSSRGTRYEQPPPARQPAAILFFASPTSELSRRLAKLAVPDALRKVGYQSTLVESAEQFAAAIRGRRWDLIVADAADVKMIEGTEPAGQRAAVMPVTYSTARAEWNTIKRQYPRIVKAPGRARHFIDAIDAALEAQRSGRASRSRL